MKISCNSEPTVKMDLIIACEIFMGIRCEYCFAYLDTNHQEKGGV